MSAFRPSLTEDERQLLIDVLAFAAEELRSETFPTDKGARKLAFTVCRRKVQELQRKLFPELYRPIAIPKAVAS